MSTSNNRLSTPICLHGRTPSNRQGVKTFLRGKQQRELKAVPKRWDGQKRNGAEAERQKREPDVWRWEKHTVTAFTKVEARAMFRVLHGGPLPAWANIVKVQRKKRKKQPA